MHRQALAERWHGAFRMSTDRGYIDHAISEIVHHHQSPLRAYHTLVHVEHVHRELAPIVSELENPEGVSVATDTHDIIQEPKVGGDEENSLKWAETTLEMFGIPKHRCSSLAPCVLATKHAHDGPPKHPDAQYFADADLAILGQSAGDYAVYVAGVRQEYAWVPEFVYRQERAKVLQAFLDRSRVYWTEYFQDKYETIARQNVAAEIKALSNPA